MGAASKLAPSMTKEYAVRERMTIQSIINRLNHRLTQLCICVLQASNMFQSCRTIITLIYKNIKIKE